MIPTNYNKIDILVNVKFFQFQLLFYLFIFLWGAGGVFKMAHEHQQLLVHFLSA